MKSGRGATTSAAVLARVARGWVPFRAAVRAADAERTISAGWRVRDLVAHVLGWEAETARRLAVFRRDGVQLEPPLPTDELNADSVARYGRLRLRTLLDELDRTHAALVHEIGALSDAELRANDAWARTIIAGNTYDHYAEHESEVRPVSAGS